MAGGLTHEAIRPLLGEASRAGEHLRCVFRCPRTGVTALASVAPGAGGDGLWASLRGWLAGVLAGVLGREDDAEVSAADVVRAFRQVQGRFHWDGEAWHGRPSAKLAAGFQRQLDAAPISAPEDRRLLERMLVEIACADRDVSPEEEAFLSECLGSADAVRQAAEAPPLQASDLKLSTARRAAGETALMLAWTMAYCDRELALSELNRLNRYAEHMGLAEQVVSELRTHAQELLLERALSRAWGEGGWSEAALAEARGLAEAMGVEPADLERAEAEVSGQ